MVYYKHMRKGYNNRALTTDTEPKKQVFFFPKNSPPVSVEAETIEEAEAKLEEINNKNIK